MERWLSINEESYREICQLHLGVHLGVYLMCEECCKPWSCPTLVLVRKLRNLECSLLYTEPRPE